MRNLKRVLSLSLASVMLFGMMVIGSSAASAAKGYPDVDKDAHNIEAIDVLQTIEVMIGYTEEEGGGFQPNKPVTRAEMMVIMAKLLDLDYNYYSATCPFTDVPEWARGYVGAAYANKVAVGRGDGIFDPNSPVTPVEASAFLMRALGYFQYSNDYANGFELDTVTQGSKIGIYDGVSSSASEPMTRNQVAKMVLNTLESGMVQPDGNTINLTTPDGSVLTGKVNYVYVTSNKDFATSISSVQATSMGSTNGGYIVEMGEQLYNGDLKLFDGRMDDFGRPSRYWEYDGKGIGTYMKKDLLREEYTTKVTGKDLYDLLGSAVLDDYTLEIHIDGEEDEAILNDSNIISATATNKNQYYFNRSALNRTNTNQVGGTGNGVLTQVFVDGNKHIVYIAIINTYLAKAVADYNTSRDEATFDIYNLIRVTTDGYGHLVKDCGKAGETNGDEERTVLGEIVYGEDFDGKYDITGIEADDIVLVRVADNEIKEILTPDVIDETEITAFKTDSYVVAGEQINYAHTAMYDTEVLDNYVQTNMKDTTYRIFLDPYGYLIGLEEVEKENNYVFLTGINSTTENLKDQTAIGNVIFLDGTSQNVTINMKDSKNAQDGKFVAPSGPANYTNVYNIRTDTRVTSLMNTWCTYSVDDNGVYTLQEVPNTKGSYDNKLKTMGVGQNHMGGTYYVGQNDEDNGIAPNLNINGGNVDNVGVSSPVLVSSNAGLYTNKWSADEKYVEINKGNVRLDGIPGSDWVVVYGNNDTVYLSAEVEYLSAARNTLSDASISSNPAVIITGADAVAVGVQDVDMAAYNAQAVVKNLLGNDKSTAVASTLKYMDVSHGVYTLYDKNGYVIAAMVVGADEGTNTSYAWVSSSDMNREALVDGSKWEYSREVIIDGQKTTLTEIETSGTATPDIANNGYTWDNVTPYNNQDPDKSNGYGTAGTLITSATSTWWQVKTKADGTVKEASRITFPWADANDTHNYIYDIADDTRDGTTILNQSFWMDDIASGVDRDLRDTRYILKDTVDIDVAKGFSAANLAYEVRVTGNTLQVEGSTGSTRGFAVNENANIVLVQDEIVWRDGKAVGTNNKATIEYFANNRNAAGLKQAVNRLNDSKDFHGFIAAVLVDGRAETVIIYDKTQSNVFTGSNTLGSTVNIEAVEDTDRGAIYVIYNDAVFTTPALVSANVTAKAQQEAIAKMLEKTYGAGQIVSMTVDRSVSPNTITYEYVLTNGFSISAKYEYYVISDIVDWKVTMGETSKFGN